MPCVVNKNLLEQFRSVFCEVANLFQFEQKLLLRYQNNVAKILMWQLCLKIQYFLFVRNMQILIKYLDLILLENLVDAPTHQGVAEIVEGALVLRKISGGKPIAYHHIRIAL